MWQYLPLMLGEMAISAAILGTASLSFVRWVMKREDRIDAEIEAQIETGSLSDEVWKLKHDTLIKQRKELVEGWHRRAHMKSEAEEISERIESVDRELLRIGVRVVKEIKNQ